MAATAYDSTERKQQTVANHACPLGLALMALTTAESFHLSSLTEGSRNGAHRSRLRSTTGPLGFCTPPPGSVGGEGAAAEGACTTGPPRPP